MSTHKKPLSNVIVGTAGLNLEKSRAASEASAATQDISAVGNVTTADLEASQQVMDMTKPQVVQQANGGGFSKVVAVETANYASLNPVIRFDYDNTGGGAVAETLRIGGIVSLAGVAATAGLAAGGADSAILEDQVGVGVLATQFFSNLSNHNPVIINLIKILTDDTTQLQQEFTHNIIGYDRRIHPTSNEVGATIEKSDDRTNLQVASGHWILSPENFFEYTVRAAIEVTWYIYLAAVSSVESFTPLAR